MEGVLVVRELVTVTLTLCRNADSEKEKGKRKSIEEYRGCSLTV
jgi:hypothetical protein